MGILPIILLLLALMALSCGPGKQSSAKGRDEGERLFAANCASCHGGQGDRIPAAPLSSKDFLETRGDATLMTAISEGKGVMQAFGKGRGGPLNDEQVRQVLAYLNSKVGRATPSLLADVGKTVYDRNCIACHGEKGDRVPIAPLVTKGFLDIRSDNSLMQAITDGKGVMPPLGRVSGGSLSDDDVKAVVAFLRYRVDAATAEMARRGRDLYMSSCLSCHGERGDRVKNVDLASGKLLQDLGDGAIIAAINQGKGTMPGFGKGATGGFGLEETAATVAYMKAWAGLSSTSALLGPAAQGQGRDLYVQNCAPCHGESGDKVPGFPLASAQFLERQTEAVLFQTTVQGNPRGMPAWGRSAGGPLAEEQIKSILDYLKSAAKIASPSASAAPVVSRPAAPVSSGTTSGAASATGPASATKGKEVFTQNCVACHGETRDKMPTAKLADGSWLKQRGDEALLSGIISGKGAMPGFGKAKGGALSDEDAKAVLAYLKQAAGVSSSSGPAEGSSGSPSGTDSGLASKGKELFGKNCAACHGETRDKMPTAKLADGSWLKQRGDEALLSGIISGKGAMPGFGKAKGGALSDEDAKAVLAYLKQAAGG